MADLRQLILVVAADERVAFILKVLDPPYSNKYPYV
jgi:hypothetical protein